jgi:hypothetical protein
MADQEYYYEETTEDPPPPYEASAPDRNTRQITPNLENQWQPGPARNGRWNYQEIQRVTVRFIFSPNPSLPFPTHDWMAVLYVECRDVPRLMREGFYWDRANVIYEDEHVFTRTDPEVNQEGQHWCGKRYYYLKDLQQPQRWTATLHVYTLTNLMLYYFDLGQLSKERFQRTFAYSPFGRTIYQYHYSLPRCCYNLIYNNMPIEGQWPWPTRCV